MNFGLQTRRLNIQSYWVDFSEENELSSVTTPCNKDKRDQFSQFMMDMAIATFNRCFKFKNNFPEGRICITG